ncbi:DUF6588 family protein [Carboxylicivirga marina]|uniref:Outer membrane protein beta-barrel domain-containing protein n=1 Tax=Carboxylicivirga marina TaxID=2800988 RepID=A0ABS1HN05_9BACT|nr:DUF6588 family protein [Carboxylicivirga marina]MBK3519062.1 hypothetical protein [Carboxylicivirga marina]
MKKIRLLLCVALIATTSQVFGQGQIIDFLKAGQADANTLSQAYLLPYGEMLGVNLNSGWYNTAKVHKIGGFDITFSTSYTTAPNSKKSFDPSSLDLKAVAPENTGMAPTMAGSKSSSMGFYMKDDPSKTNIIDMKGAGADYFVSPMIQAAVGLPFHTEIMGRFMPTMGYGDYGEASLWGIGLKHSIKDYIPFVKRVPFLQASVLAAYTDFGAKLGVSNTGSLEGIGTGTGNLETSAGAFTSRLLVGINVPVVSFYTGLGYGTTTSNFDIIGDFTGYEDTNNPIALDYKTSGFDFNAGMRLRFAIFSLHADYTVGEYSVITAGVGINFR